MLSKIIGRKVTVKTFDGETITGYWRTKTNAEDNIIANTLVMLKDKITPNLIYIPLIRIKSFETELIKAE